MDITHEDKIALERIVEGEAGVESFDGKCWLCKDLHQKRNPSQCSWIEAWGYSQELYRLHYPLLGEDKIKVR